MKLFILVFLIIIMGNKNAVIKEYSIKDKEALDGITLI